VLPVEWLSITAEWKGDHNEVRWSTASENNNEIFEIERRLMSESEFYQVGEIDAAGNSTTLQKYAFRDEDNETSDRYYYRIKQVDFDGSYDYSPTVFVEVARRTAEVSLYPNPSVGTSRLTLDMATGHEIDVTIFDADGRLVREHLVPEGNTATSTELTIDNLPAGVYMIHVVQDEYSEVKKLIVIK